MGDMSEAASWGGCQFKKTKSLQKPKTRVFQWGESKSFPLGTAASVPGNPHTLGFLASFQEQSLEGGTLSAMQKGTRTT